jgi:hypothetical protein
VGRARRRGGRRVAGHRCLVRQRQPLHHRLTAVPAHSLRPPARCELSSACRPRRKPGVESRLCPARARGEPGCGLSPTAPAGAAASRPLLGRSPADRAIASAEVLA